MGGENEQDNQIPPDDRQPDPIDALKAEVQNLKKTIDEVRDSQQQINNSQGQIAKALAITSRTAEAAMEELNKTKAEFLTAFQGIQGKAITPDMIKEGMKSFADEIAKATDAKLTAFMDSFAQQPVSGQPGTGQVMRQGGGSISDLLSILLQNADGLAKLMAAFKPAPPATAPLADALISYKKLRDFEKTFAKDDVPLDQYAKAAHETFDPPVAPKQ